MASELRTGELAREANVNVETLRFYERKGILPEPPRRSSGYRAYPAQAVERVRFIRRAQELGFSLKEIEQLLASGTDPRSTCADVKEHVTAKVTDIDQKIRDLQAIKRALNRLSEACPGRGSTEDCPILGLVRFGRRDPVEGE